jgi:hypothetical protein
LCGLFAASRLINISNQGLTVDRIGVEFTTQTNKETNMIKVKTTAGLDTDLTVQLMDIHDGAMVTLVITDQADQESIMVYDDEIDGLIEALNRLKGGLK